MKRFANNTDAPSTPRTDRHPVQRLPHTPINERRAFIVHIIGQRTRRNDVARVFITARCALSARYHFRGTSCCNEPRFMLKCTRCAHTCHAVPRLPRLNLQMVQSCITHRYSAKIFQHATLSVITGGGSFVLRLHGRVSCQFSSRVRSLGDDLSTPVGEEFGKHDHRSRHGNYVYVYTAHCALDSETRAENEIRGGKASAD